MGCLSAPKEDPLVVLGRVRNNLLTQIELNRIKIEKKEKNIQDLDNQIKQLENDLKQNQYSYSDTEKKQKARQIMGLKKDLLLEEKSLEEEVDIRNIYAFNFIYIRIRNFFTFY